jgi:thioredoxin-like negative regulator of GroEL
MVVELTDGNYVQTVEENDVPIFIDFYSPSCGPCQELLPLLDSLDKHYDRKVLISKVDVSKNPKLAQKYAISSVPFCVIIGKDKMVKKAEVGLLASDMYFKMCDKAVDEKKSWLSKIFGG